MTYEVKNSKQIVINNYICSGFKMALAFKAQGRFKDASKLFKEVYEGRKETLGEDHEDTQETLKLIDPN